MGSVHAYKTKAGKRYLVRYFKPDMSQGAKRGFLTKRAAEAYLSQVDIAITQQQYVDPAMGALPSASSAAFGWRISGLC